MNQSISKPLLRLFPGLLMSVLAGLTAANGASLSLANVVAGAKPGRTIELKAGNYTGVVMLPPGVSLHGAGYGKTRIDASGGPIGISITGGAGAVISDLTVSGATRINISVSDSMRTIIRRVRTTGSINGVVFSNVTDGRMENVVSDNNRYGLVAGSGHRDVIVNCTAARNSSLGISIPSGSSPVVFNNCVVDSATGIYLGNGVTDATIDYNLYSALYSGKLEGQLGRKSIGEWSYLSGQDHHSIAIPVYFGNPEIGDFRPANPLAWALNRTPATGFGTEQLAGTAAPTDDIEHGKRTSPYDLGAYVSHSTAPRPPDGFFKVTSGKGITSAGVFTPDGKEVAYLFQNMPLAAGRYPFWLPTRDFQYRRIPPGQYDVRTTESNLAWDYLGHIGDTGAEYPFGADAPIGAARVAFDDAGHLLAGNDGWAEDFIDVRGYEAETGKFLWTFRAGADTRGLAVSRNGSAYLLRLAGKEGRMTKLNPANGQVLGWPGGQLALPLRTGPEFNGLTTLNNQLIATDGANIYFSSNDGPDFSKPIPLPGASYPSADAKNNLVWALAANNQLVALKPDGTTLVTATPVAAPCALAVRNGRMAIASGTAGKIYLLDCSDPHNLKVVSSIGAGDGPFGAFAPDRFLFQSAPGRPAGSPSLALGPNGDLAIGDGNRLIVFDANGKNLWYTFGVFGNGTVPSYGTISRRFDTGGEWSMALDLKAGTWKPEAYWKRPTLPAKAQFFGETAVEAHNFGVYSVDTGQGHGIEFVKIEGFTQIPVLQITGKGATWVSRKDTNHDGIIDDTDTAQPFDNHGLGWDNPSVRSNGGILTNGNGMLATLWRCGGIDGDGAPIYKAEAAASWKSQDYKSFVSPYTAGPDHFGLAAAQPTEDGGLGALINISSAPGGTGLLNGAGTDMAGFDAAGNLRWLHPLAEHKGLYNFQKLGPVYVSGVGQTTEVECVDKDGLGLGTLGQAAISHYAGYWLDHAGALQAWQGQDGRRYLLLADNFNGMHHWYRLGNEDQIVHTTTPVTVSAAEATTMAALPAPDPKLAIERPAPPVVILPQLKAPLPIDGDLAKWRTAGIAPNIIITPDTAVAGIDGPLDASAVVRMAYFGTDLYVQVLRFDENPVFFQPVSRHYVQPCIEMAINGFGPGFKFDITKTTDAGDIIIRQRFFFQKYELLVPPDHAPRVIKILDNAQDVPERSLIESVYGVNLAPDKVIVTEFKLPMDAITYKDAEADAPKMTPGSSFWLGFMIDDNNQPGADLQNLMVWPATYGTFNPPEDGAKAVLGP